MAAVFRSSRSKGGARLVLLALADEANEEGYVTAYKRSQSHLARKANVGRGTARTALQLLEELGEIEIIKRGDGRASSDYRIVLPGLIEGVENRPPQIEGAQDQPPGGQESTPRGPEIDPQGAKDRPPIIPFFPGSPPSSPSVDGQAALALVDPEPTFEQLWDRYPRRDGKRIARDQAAKQWRRLTGPERIAARRAVEHYRAACDAGLTRAKDAHRWLRDRAFNDWLEPAVADGPAATGSSPPARREHDPIDRARALAVTYARSEMTEAEALASRPKDLEQAAAYREAFHVERARLEAATLERSSA